MNAIALVPANQSPPCACRLCSHVAKDVARDLMRASWGRLGWLGDPARGDFEAELAAQWHEYRPHYETASDAIPPKLRHEIHSAAKTRPTVALNAARSLLECTGSFDFDAASMLVLSGPPGTGKTFAAAWALVHGYANDRGPPMLIGAVQLARLPSHGEEGEERQAILERGAIAIDDLGVERPNERFEEFVDELVDHFYQHDSQVLIITTNLTAPQFKKRYGVRVVDRLRERGVWVPCMGPSLRVREELP